MVDRRTKVISYMWRNLSIRDYILIQKSIVDWIGEEDLNSLCFHNSIKGRARRKFIGVVNMVSGVVDTVEEVKDVVCKFFHQKYKEPNRARPILEGIITRTLCLVDVNY